MTSGAGRGSLGLRATGAVLFAALLWGLWWLPLRALAAGGLDGLMANALLYGLASLVLLPWLLRRRRTLVRGGLPLSAVALAFAAALVSWNLALLWGEVVRVTLLFYLAPVWASLLGVLFLKERPGWLRGLTLVLGLAGAAVVLGAEGPPLPREAGDWAGLGSGFAFAIAVTLVRARVNLEGRDQVILSFTFAALLCLALLALPAVPLAAPPPSSLPFALLLAVGWLLPGSWLMLWGARHLEPGRVSLLLLLEVPVAAFSAALLAGEPFGARQGLGCLLVLAAGFLEGLAELKAKGAEAGFAAAAMLDPASRDGRDGVGTPMPVWRRRRGEKD